VTEKPNKVSLGHISVSTVARLLRLSRWTVVRMIQEGTLEAWRPRARGPYHVKYESVLEFRRRAGV
jgi:excisionase family DNA binding protein